jgi:hypothetical protein
VAARAHAREIGHPHVNRRRKRRVDETDSCESELTHQKKEVAMSKLVAALIVTLFASSFACAQAPASASASAMAADGASAPAKKHKAHKPKASASASAAAASASASK